MKNFTNERDFFNAIIKNCGIDSDEMTKEQENRYEKACALYFKAVENGDSGAWGKAVEIMSRRPLSRKQNIAKQGKADASAHINGKLIPCEIKTNGGRIDGIKEKYIVYSMRVHNSTANVEITARIIPSVVFIEKLYELNAVKTVRHNGMVDGLAIQPSKRALWAWLEECPEYFPDWEYVAEDFEGL